MFSRRGFVVAFGAGLSYPSLLRAQTSSLAPRFAPQQVRIKSEFAPDQIVVVTAMHYLYLVTGPGRAIRYGIGVGREGLAFQGAAVVQRKREWPSWRPTPEMIKRSPATYARFVGNEYVQPGGPANPLGARALYLYQNGRDTLFRIHGTIEPESIGRSVSNGCIRMINEHVIDLYDRVPLGTTVVVV